MIKIFIVFFGFVLPFFSCTLAQEEDRVSCPTKSPYVMIEAGLRHVDKDGYAFPFGLRPDTSSGVEGEKLREFDGLLGEKQPIIMHCYANKYDFWKEINAVDIILPPAIWRCVQRDFKTPMVCKSGSDAYPPAEGAYIVLQDNGQSVQLEPIKEKSGVLRWRDLDNRGAGKKLVAHCFQRSYSDKKEEYVPLELASDLKECVLTRPHINRKYPLNSGLRHFICSSTPDVHDDFWPKL